MRSYDGPFFTKNPDGSYSLADICKNCAFGDKDGCLLSPCTYLFAVADNDNTEEVIK